MWPFAVAVLPCQAGAGDRRLLALSVGVLDPAGACGVVVIVVVVAAVVCVHSGEEVRMLRPPLVEAVVAGHRATPTAHLDEGVTLGVVARHRDTTTYSGSFWNHLLLERSRRGRGGGGWDGRGGGWVVGGRRR